MSDNYFYLPDPKLQELREFLENEIKQNQLAVEGKLQSNDQHSAAQYNAAKIAYQKSLDVLNDV